MTGHDGQMTGHDGQMTGHDGQMEDSIGNENNSLTEGTPMCTNSSQEDLQRNVAPTENERNSTSEINEDYNSMNIGRYFSFLDVPQHI